MIETLYKKMAIPDACLLGKRIFKKLFHDNAKLGATDKKAFREDIDVIISVVQPRQDKILPGSNRIDIETADFHGILLMKTSFILSNSSTESE